MTCFEAGRFNARGNKESATLTGFNEEILTSLGGELVGPDRSRAALGEGAGHGRPAGPGVSPAHRGLRFAALRLEGPPQLPSAPVLAGDSAAGRRRVRLPEPAGGGRIHPGPKPFSPHPWSGPVGTVRAVGGSQSAKGSRPWSPGSTGCWATPRHGAGSWSTSWPPPASRWTVDRSTGPCTRSTRPSATNDPRPCPTTVSTPASETSCRHWTGLQGTHLPWSAPDLGDEPDWVEDVLAMRRQFVDLRQQHRPSNFGVGPGRPSPAARPPSPPELTGPDR